MGVADGPADFRPGRFPVDPPPGRAEELWRLLQGVDSWGFCCFKLEEATAGRPLLFLVWHLIHTRCARAPSRPRRPPSPPPPPPAPRRGARTQRSTPLRFPRPATPRARTGPLSSADADAGGGSQKNSGWTPQGWRSSSSESTESTSKCPTTTPSMRLMWCTDATSSWPPAGQTPSSDAGSPQEMPCRQTCSASP